MSKRLTHSKLAVVSTILPVAVWFYLGLLILLVTRKSFVQFVNWIFDDSFGALGVVLIVGIFLFGVIPIAGHLAGIVCGIIGLFSKNKNRIFAVIGLILTVVPFVAGLIIYKSGYDFGIR